MIMTKQRERKISDLESVEVGAECPDQADVSFGRSPIAHGHGATAGARPCACVVVGHVRSHAQRARHAANHDAAKPGGHRALPWRRVVQLQNEYREHDRQ